jgi:malonyl-CoA decarboxylase
MKAYVPRLGLEDTSAFLSDLIDNLTDRGRALIGRKEIRDGVERGDLLAMTELLLSRRGEASGVVLAQTLLASYAAAAEPQRLAFLKALAERFGPDPKRLSVAVDAFREDANSDTVNELHAAAEPRRQELFRRLNLAPGGTGALVAMRHDLLGFLPRNPELRAVDADFTHLLSSWFNRGFLVLRPIDWTTPANILEKIIRYEAVHAINDWVDLRNRLKPSDRKCFAFFHPQLADEPLIFVEVALTTEVPGSIAPLLDSKRTPIRAQDATTAVFYSISNTQKGLGGVSFGNFLIKQVVDDLRRELPNLRTFVTLSPVPGFASWLSRQRSDDTADVLNQEDREALALLDELGWQGVPVKSEAIRKALLPAAASYFLRAKTPKGRPVDPVARFHLGNGARLERLNFLGDISSNGLKQAHGFMVNYCYDLADIEKNHEAFAEKGEVVVSPAVRKLLRSAPSPRDQMAPKR